MSRELSLRTSSKKKIISKRKLRSEEIILFIHRKQGKRRNGCYGLLEHKKARRIYHTEKIKVRNDGNSFLLYYESRDRE